MQNKVVEVKNLNKTFKTGFLKPRFVHAVKNVSFTVSRNEIFGILGPNGAGKTTIMNILSSLLKPDSGYVEILNTNVSKHFPNSLKLRLNMCSGNPNFPWCMTVKEILFFYAKLYNLSNEKIKTKIDELVDLFELKKIFKVRYDELSTGNKQRLALAKSLLNDPEIILFDEPTIGLDPDISKKIRDIIKQIKTQKNITILLTTHYMKEAEELCDRIAFIKEGTILTIGTPQELKNIAQKNSLEETFIELVNK